MLLLLFWLVLLFFFLFCFFTSLAYFLLKSFWFYLSISLTCFISWIFYAGSIQIICYIYFTSLEQFLILPMFLIYKICYIFFYFLILVIGLSTFHIYWFKLFIALPALLIHQFNCLFSSFLVYPFYWSYQNYYNLNGLTILWFQPN